MYLVKKKNFIFRFFDLLRSQYTFDQEQFIVTLGSGWNIPVDLVIGPNIGISYITHPQAKPTRVTDFQNIERILTSNLATSLHKDSNSSDSSTSNNFKGSANNTPNSPSSNKKSSDKRQNSTCNCNDIKTQLKIKVIGNAEDLVIACSGLKTADSIADLVDGYCRIVSNNDISLWDRTCTYNCEYLCISFKIFIKKKKLFHLLIQQHVQRQQIVQLIHWKNQNHHEKIVPVEKCIIKTIHRK